MNNPSLPILALSNIGKTYPGPVPVVAVHDVDLEVLAGDFVSVMGRSGSGKSTLLHIMGLIDRPTHGVYKVNGVSVTELTEKQITSLRGRSMGFVHQAYNLLTDRPALENVMMASLYQGVRSNEARSRSMQALERVGLDNRAAQPCRLMSGGEKQRIAIARALAANPLVLLCDEPTGNLDSRTSISIMELFAELNGQGVTIVVITHDRSTARFAGRAFVMTDGVLDEAQPEAV